MTTKPPDISLEIPDDFQKLAAEVGPVAAAARTGVAKDLAKKTQALLKQHNMKIVRDGGEGHSDVRRPSAVVAENLRRLTYIIDDFGCKYVPSSRKFTGGVFGQGMECTIDELVRLVYAGDSPRWTANAVAAAAQMYVNRERHALINELKTWVNIYDPSIGDREVRKFVAYMTGEGDLDAVRVEDIAAMQSMLWQIKRKVNGFHDVVYPIMVLFTGGQGFGKTWATTKLFDRLKLWSAGPVGLKRLNDSFSTSLFSDCFIVPFQDMHAERDTDLSKLKTLITEPTIAHRNPHQRDVLQLPNNSTCYATSNFAIADMLADDTGARRWWEIKSPDRESTDEERAFFKTIDFDALWNSIDGSTEVNPRVKYLKTMSVTQDKELRAPTLIGRFFAEEIDGCQGAEGRLDERVLFARLKDWAYAENEKAPKKVAVRKYCAAAKIGHTNTSGIYTWIGIRLRPAERAGDAGWDTVATGEDGEE